MWLRRVSSGLLAGALLVACGERAGDPIVRLASDTGDTGGSSGEVPSEPVGDAGSGVTNGNSDDPLGSGPIGLCGVCQTSEECGDADDACLLHEGEHFCGRDCDENWGCPGGYTCVELDNVELFQCVPTNGCSEAVPEPPALDQVRSYLLARINAERLARDRPALAASSCLDDLAQGSALDYAGSDEPLGKYVRECDPVWPNCSCGWNAEAELTLARYGLDWLTAIESALGNNRNNDDRFVDAFLAADASDVGIGFWISGDEAWIALSFR